MTIYDYNPDISTKNDQRAAFTHEATRDAFGRHIPVADTNSFVDHLPLGTAIVAFPDEFRILRTHWPDIAEALALDAQR